MTLTDIYKLKQEIAAIKKQIEHPATCREDQRLLKQLLRQCLAELDAAE